MKQTLLLLALAVAAHADISNSATLGDGYYFNLDTAKLSTITPPSGDVYDIQFKGGDILGVGKAQIANVGIRTSGQFDLVTESDIKNHLILGGVRSIPAVNLAAGDIFEVITNAGNASKVFVVRNASGIMSINFFTYQSAALGAPKLTGVFNNSSLIGDGLPNSGIAPSSLFIVRGTGMADTTPLALQSSAPPGLPLTLNGASLSVLVGGVTTHPAIYYTSPTQLAAVLPANTPPGTGTLTASYNGIASAPFPIKVVNSAPGLNVYGANTGVATDGVTGAVLTFTNSGTPNEVIVLWATGLGADFADSDTTYATAPHAVSTPLQVYI
ncbi:MAG: hypothetical protein ACRD9W_19485, partial [Terriglobia bacterium]